MENKQCGIYAFTNELTGQMYVGQSNDIDRRYHAHLGAINRGEHNKFYDDVYVYGLENFKFAIIEELPEDEDILNEREIYWISYFDSLENGYNTSPGGGVKRDEETRRKCSEGGKKGMTNANHKMWQDPEYRKHQADKMRETVNKLLKDEEYMKKRSKLSSETAKKMWQDPEIRERISKSISERMKKRWSDPNFRKEMSEKNKRNWQDPEYRERMSKKNSDVQKKRWQNDEYRKNIIHKFKLASIKNNSDEAYLKKHYNRRKNVAVNNNLVRWSKEEEHKKLSERNANSIWINNGEINKKILCSELDNYDLTIWKKGMVKGKDNRHKAKGRIWIHNDEKSKMIVKDELQKYLDKGYTLGRLKCR